MKPSPAVSLLLTNLRLLDYDFAAFPITADVFTSLTNKGKAFEHIIYHLFSIFDPEECALKLHTCWPIYEPAQSRELRNVVFKWLDDIKKSGRLGGVLIRRTTLDDCCGPRYEELLLALSTMVLRDRIEGGGWKGYTPSTAYHQATSNAPNPAYLTPLTIAHRVVLESILEARRSAKAQWESFARLLEEKEAMLAAMAGMVPSEEEEAAAAAAAEKRAKPSRPRGYEENIRRKWENNWLGDPRWLDIILNGDPESTRDRFLELPFEQAWENRQYFEGSTMAATPAVSLKGLENQVAEQRRRVAEIRKLRELSLTGASSPVKSGAASPIKMAPEEQKEKKKGLGVEFNRHQDLHMKNMVGQQIRGRVHQSEYADLLSSLREEMMLTGAPTQRAHEKPEVPVYYSYDGPEQAEQSQSQSPATPAEMDDGPEVYHLRINLQEGGGSSDPESCDGGIQDDMPSPVDTQANQDDDAMDLDDEMDVDQEEGYGQQQESSYYQPSKSPSLMPGTGETSAIGSGMASCLNSSDEDEPELMPPQIPEIRRQESTPTQPINSRARNELSFGMDDELFAEQIVSSIAAASFSPEKPSPMKGRGVAITRQKGGMMPWERAATSSPPAPLGPNFEDDFGDDTTMTLPPDEDEPEVQESPTRTRNNNLIAAPGQPPVVSATPTEDLIAGGDYNSVFKSRPKIALSPTFTPSPPRNGGPVKGLNISMTGGDDDSDDEDEDEVMEYISSPLTSKIRR